MTSESLALIDSAEAVIDLGAILKGVVQFSEESPIWKANVDNKALVKPVYSTRLVQDEQLWIDLSVLRDMIEQIDINAMSWIQLT